MDVSLTKIEAEALQLSAAERVRLADHLLASVAGDSGIEQEWSEEVELVEGSSYYARKANAEIAGVFISEFDRSAKLLGEHPKLGSRDGEVPFMGQASRESQRRRFAWGLPLPIRKSD